MKPNIRIVIPVKTGIQGNEEDGWIPASAGMTDRIRKIGQVDFESTAF